MTQRRNRDWVYAFLMLGTVLFIWGHSLAPASVSGEESGNIADLLRKILGGETAFAQWVIHYIRKIAHFSEYFLLGTEAAFWSLNGDKKKKRAGVLSLSGVLIAMADEGIQLWAEGRAASMTDVGIDLCGFFCAMVAILPVAFLLIRRKNKEK